MAADSTRRFSDRVGYYVRSRPGYPGAFYSFLREELGLTSGTAVADIGSGTGISARPLLEMGVVVYGVEPNGPMRGAAEKMLERFENFRSVDAVAERTGLGDSSVDLVLAAQAFHWFDKGRARAEFARVLRPGGWVVLVWNERRTGSTEFLRAYEGLLLAHGTDYAQVRHENVSAEAIAGFFAPASFEKREFENAQEFNYEGLEARLLSSSYTPGEGDVRRGVMLGELRGIFERYQEGGRVRFEYDTRAYFGRVGK